MARTTLTARHESSDVVCRRGCGNWSGTLGEADVSETANGNGVNWMCPSCGSLVGTANY